MAAYHKHWKKALTCLLKIKNYIYIYIYISFWTWTFVTFFKKNVDN